MPSEKELVQTYSEGWSGSGDPEGLTGGTDLALAKSYCAQLAISLGRSSLEGMKLLDYGAGRGALSHALADQGAEPVALDPFGCNYLKGTGVVSVSSLEAPQAKGPFDGVLLQDVIEHLPAPRQTLSRIRTHLADDGWLFVATPNASGLRARVHGPVWREARREGHLMLFSGRSLAHLLQISGFARCKRLRWQIRYSENVARRALHWALQASGADGELRYLAWKG
jgi:2-polyprenyl-3-methyl-5-hydroxy-6-metoxy-1,4-benzoquinol methylase